MSQRYVSRDNMWQQFPVIYDFLFRIVANNDQSTFNFIMKWLAKMFKHGQTKRALVVLGSKGTGKSTFANFAANIVHKDNVSELAELQDIRSKFNNFLNAKMLVVVHEIAESVENDRFTQATLKNYITEPTVKVELKGVNSFTVRNNMNFIICSNSFSPIALTEDNRRFIVLDVSDAEKQNHDFFANLNDDSNCIIETFWWYLFNNVDIQKSCTPPKKKKYSISILLRSKFSQETFYQGILIIRSCKKFSFRKFMTFF
jgi:diphthamide synthase subunit DPH2